MKQIILAIMALMTFAVGANAQRDYETIFGRVRFIKNAYHKKKPYKQVDRNNMRAVAENLLRFQNPDGGWPRSVDWLDEAPVDSILAYVQTRYKRSTLENKNVSTQLEYMASAYRTYKDDRFRLSALRALNFILGQQMPCGGWGGTEFNNICFGSNIMPSVLKVLNLVGKGTAPYDWIPKKYQERAQKAYERGLEVALKCQIVLPDGTLTGWSQHHDKSTFKATKARSYELPCISSAETSYMATVLMGMPNPTPEVKKAIIGAMTWLEKSALKGIKIENIELSAKMQEQVGKKYDRKVVKDPSAPRIWARCYDIETNVPFFCNRDGGKKLYSLAEVELERRANYGWYGYWPESSVLLYKAWKARYGVK